jgi:hypothetical protein
VAPKGKAFLESMKLRQPIFRIVDMPITDTILADRFFMKKEEIKKEESTNDKLMDNRGSVIDMFEVSS